MANTKINPGVYTVGELLNAAGVDFNEVAKVDYGSGIDYRRVKVGGLTFGDLSQVIVVADDPETTTLEIRVNDKKVSALTVDHSQEYRHSSEVADGASFPVQPNAAGIPLTN